MLAMYVVVSAAAAFVLGAAWGFTRSEAKKDGGIKGMSQAYQHGFQDGFASCKLSRSLGPAAGNQALAVQRGRGALGDQHDGGSASRRQGVSP